MKPPLRTISDHYRADRAEAASEKDAERAKERVWRTYTIAMMRELARRQQGALGGPSFRWRRASGDDALPQPFVGYWKRISDDDLAGLWDTLIKAGYRGMKP